MTYDEVLKLIKELAQGQGFYGRLLRSIENLDDDKLDKFIEIIEEQNFKEPLDFILWIEG